jgi:hypothetical protein
MRNKIVIKQEDRTPKVPRVFGSGCNETVSLAVMLPNIENVVRDVGALTCSEEGLQFESPEWHFNDITKMKKKEMKMSNDKR